MKDVCLRLVCLTAVFAACVFLEPVSKAGAAVDPVVVELHYQNGVKYYKRGLYDKAIGEFEKTLSLDSSHEEAKGFIEKIQKMDEKQKRVEAKKSEDARMRELYKKGKELYAQHDFEGALAVFQEILKIKPVDDFASFYRERCEIFISRKLAREKRVEEKQKLKEKKIKEKEDRVKQKELALERKRQLAEERVRIKEEHRQALQDKKSVIVKQQVDEAVIHEKTAEVEIVVGEVVQESSGKEERLLQGTAKKELEAAERKKDKEEKLAAAKQRRVEKLAAAEERKQEKLARAEKIRQEKEQARQVSILSAQEKKQARLQDIEAKKEAARQKKTKKNPAAESSVKPAEKETRVQGQKSAKDLYLEGAEHLGRKEYAEAVQSFSAVIEQEKGGSALYTNAAKRLMEKAQVRLAEAVAKEAKQEES